MDLSTHFKKEKKQTWFFGPLHPHMHTLYCLLIRYVQIYEGYIKAFELSAVHCYLKKKFIEMNKY